MLSRSRTSLVKRIHPPLPNSGRLNYSAHVRSLKAESTLRCLTSSASLFLKAVSTLGLRRPPPFCLGRLTSAARVHFGKLGVGCHPRAIDPVLESPQPRSLQAQGALGRNAAAVAYNTRGGGKSRFEGGGHAG